ncbi:MAG TPA: hypothetical protein VNE16_00290 [Vicinamibacterales bacterium]|nr:hypothetical protein [Vicinamibacterales bacterium]
MEALPFYALVGLLAMLVSEAGMLLHVQPFWSWHTPIAWTGFILFADGLVRRRRGRSWLTTAPREFAFLALASIPLWLIFEGYNLLIRNWRYVNLPQSAFWRNFGFAWAFATIWPAIFEMADLVATFRRHDAGPAATPPAAARRFGPARALSAAAGAAMLIWPLVRPARYLAAPVWLGFILLLDPINAAAGGDAIIADWRSGSRDRLVNLAVAGFACGLLWEFWNYWAHTKWLYTMPFLPPARLFEMPLPGYLGFPAFALECFTMYVTVRLLFWRARTYRIGI